MPKEGHRSSRSSSKEKKEKDSKKSRDKSSSEKSKSSKSKKSDGREEKTSSKSEKPRELTKLTKPQPSIQDNYGYEDDFEDYEEDFEEDVSEEETPKQSTQDTTTPSKKMPEKQKVSVEVEETPLMRRLASRQGGRPIEEDRKVEKSKKLQTQQTRILSASERVIDFSHHYSTDYEALSDAEKKYRKLREMISLERIKILILDQPPVKDYDYYMELFGAAGKAQNFCQTGDDNMDEEIQTDEPVSETKWTMHPANDNFGWGTEGSQQIDTKEAEEERNLQMFRENHLQKERLKHFVETAGQIIIDLIASRHRKDSDHFVMRNKSLTAFSAGYNTFELGPVSQNCKVTAVTLNPQEKDVLLVAFYIEESPADVLLKRTLLVEFDLHNNAPPKRLFLSENEVTDVAYTHDANVLYIGLKDGSVCAFDSHEPESNFEDGLPWMDSPHDIPLRLPAFDSSYASVMIHDGKIFPIVGIHAMKKESASGVLYALDESGTVSRWSPIWNSDGILGTRPGARFSMQLSSVIRPHDVVLHTNSEPSALMVNCLLVHEDSEQFLIGTDVGFLCSITRTKTTNYVGPRIYKSKMHLYGEILCARFSPFDKSIMVVGMSNGSIAILKIGQSTPLTVLTPPKNAQLPVTSLEWSPIAANVFYTVHGGSKLLVWDLSIGRAPQSINNLSEKAHVTIVVSHVWREVAKDPTGIAYMALGLLDGTVQVHALEPAKNKASESLYSLLKKFEQGI